MKKFTALLSAALIILSLGACKAEQKKEHNAIATVSETEAQTESQTEIKTTESRPVSTTKSETAKKEPEQSSARVVQAKSFSITVPASWEGRYNLYYDKPDESAEEGSLTFFSIKNKNSGGKLFTVFASSKTPEEQFNMAIPMINIGMLEKDGEQKYVYATYTTDCQYDYDNPDHIDEYTRMQRDSYDMFDGIKGTNGWKYQPLTYDREYV